MADPKVKVRIEADGKPAARELKTTESKFKKFGNSIKNALTPSFLSAAAAVAAFTLAITSSIAAFQVQEDAITKLNASLAPLGDNAAAVSASLQAQATALQQVTKFGDEAIINGQALVAAFNKDEDAIKAATVAALDLASATGQNLNSAFSLLARASAGETSALSRYGIVLDESIPKSEKFAAVIKEITKLFGGQAAAQVDTFSGAVAQLGNSFGDAQEQVGGAIAKTKGFRSALVSAKEFFDEYGAAIGKMTGLFIEFGIIVAKIVTGPLALIGRAVGAVTEKILGFQNRLDETELSGAALQRRADLMGISVGALKVKLGLLTSQTEASGKANEAAAVAAKESAEAHDDLVAAFEKVLSKAEGWKETVEEVTEEVGEQDEAIVVLGKRYTQIASEMETAATGADTFTASLAVQSAQLIITTNDFLRFERAHGRAAAEDAALASGGRIDEGGRIRLAGGGSRLRRGGASFFNTGSNFSSDQRRSYTTADGRIVFVNN